MNLNNPLDEGWYDHKKRFIRTERIVKIESWALVISSILLLASLYYIIPYLSEISVWGVTGLLSDIITFTYLVWWRKIALTYDANLSQTKWSFPSGFEAFRVIFIFNIVWAIIGLRNIFSILMLLLTDSGAFVDFSWIQYFFFKILEVALIVLSVYHIRETKKVEQFVNQ